MKKYNLIPQEKEDYCLCSVLQAILGSNGINISQKDIASKLTPAERGFLITDEKIEDFLKENGFEYKYYWRDQVPLNEIEFGLDELKKSQGFIGINEHVYLFVDYEFPKVKMIDPADGKICVKEDSEINKELYKPKMGLIGLIRKLK